MSYIDVTKKQAKKLFGLLRDKTSNELKTITQYPVNDLENILAISKGYTGIEQMKKELLYRKEQAEIANKYICQSFNFTKDDVLNDLEPEFIDFNKQINNIYPKEFNQKKFNSERNVKIYCETDNKQKYEVFKNKELLVLSNVYYAENKDFNLSVFKENYSNFKINPLNHLIFNYEKNPVIFSSIKHDYLIEFIRECYSNKKQIKLKSFKGILNLNYLLKYRKERYSHHLEKYLNSIGLIDDNITDEVVKRHLIYSKEGLIFAQIMMDFSHCFTETPEIDVFEKHIDKNFFIHLVDKINENGDNEKEYFASQIIKNYILKQIYAIQFKNEANLKKNTVILDNISSQVETHKIVIFKDFSQLKTIDEEFTEITLTLPFNDIELSLKVKKAILESDYEMFLEIINNWKEPQRITIQPAKRKIHILK